MSVFDSNINVDSADKNSNKRSNKRKLNDNGDDGIFNNIRQSLENAFNSSLEFISATLYSNKNTKDCSKETEMEVDEKEILHTPGILTRSKTKQFEIKTTPFLKMNREEVTSSVYGNKWTDKIEGIHPISGDDLTENFTELCKLITEQKKTEQELKSNYKEFQELNSNKSNKNNKSKKSTLNQRSEKSKSKKNKISTQSGVVSFDDITRKNLLKEQKYLDELVDENEKVLKVLEKNLRENEDFKNAVNEIRFIKNKQNKKSKQTSKTKSSSDDIITEYLFGFLNGKYGKDKFKQYLMTVVDNDQSLNDDVDKIVEIIEETPLRKIFTESITNIKFMKDIFGKNFFHELSNKNEDVCWICGKPIYSHGEIEHKIDAVRSMTLIPKIYHYPEQFEEWKDYKEKSNIQSDLYKYYQNINSKNPNFSEAQRIKSNLIKNIKKNPELNNDEFIEVLFLNMDFYADSHEACNQFKLDDKIIKILSDMSIEVDEESLKNLSDFIFNFYKRVRKINKNKPNYIKTENKTIMYDDKQLKKLVEKFLKKRENKGFQPGLTKVLDNKYVTTSVGTFSNILQASSSSGSEETQKNEKYSRIENIVSYIGKDLQKFHRQSLKHPMDKKYYITKTVTNVMSSAVKTYNNKKTNNLTNVFDKEPSGYSGDVSSNRTNRRRPIKNNSSKKRKRT